MIIVLSGQAGAGKDSVADILAREHGFAKYSLAAPLKRFAKDMFGFTDEQLYGPSSARNAIDQRWVLKCLECGGTGTVLGTDTSHAPCEGTGRVRPISPRSVLVPLGTEYLRDLLHPDILTMRARPEIESLARTRSVVINDARYQNDRDNLATWLNAMRVDVRAPGKKSDGAAWRQHRSELDRPADSQVEYVIENPEEWPFPGLPGRVEAMLNDLAL